LELGTKFSGKKEKMRRKDSKQKDRERERNSSAQKRVGKERIQITCYKRIKHWNPFT